MNRPGFELPPKSWTNFKGFMQKHETEFKWEVVQSFLPGEGDAKFLARR